jgi:hypothetical protein
MSARYCRAFTSRYPFGGGLELVYAGVSKSTTRISAAAAACIQSCSQFRTIEQHAAAWRKQGSGESESRLAEDLRRHAAAGLLISDEQLIAHCKSATRIENSPPAIAAIGTSTRNRPSLLKRGLSSFLDNARARTRSVEIVVIDDGATPAERSATQEALAALARESGAAIRYAGRPERQSFADDLAAEAGVPPDVVRFALLGDTSAAITTGAARNGLLIDTIGDQFLMIDDDSVCQVAPCPQKESGVALDARTNPTELWFYRDRASLLRDTAFVEQDPLALHETILGRPVADCLPAAERASEVDLRYATADFAQRLWANPGRVLATSAGVVGDSGMGSTAYLALPPDSQARLVRSEADYASAVVNRQILRAPLRTTITRGTFCAGASLGLDNRALLPPFVPIGRNSDGLFARTLLRCFRDGYKGYLPWAVLHDPLPPRAQSLEGAESDAKRIRLTHILRALIVPDAFTQSPDSAQNVRGLGEELIEIASQPPADFQRAIKGRLVKSAALYLTAIEQAMKAAGGPEFYARRQKEHRQRLIEALTTDEYFVPRDLGDVPTEEIQRITQSVVLQFGQVLRDWPAIVAAAQSLRSRGRKLAQAV